MEPSDRDDSLRQKGLKSLQGKSQSSHSASDSVCTLSMPSRNCCRLEALSGNAACYTGRYGGHG